MCYTSENRSIDGSLKVRRLIILKKQKEYRNHLHFLLEIFTWLFMGSSFCVAIYGISTLPNKIATHFNIHGLPDGYSSPSSLLIFPIIMTICLAIISLVIHVIEPEHWNLPFEVKKENKVFVYKDMITMVLLIELEIAVFTFYIEIKSYYQSATGILAMTGIFLLLLTLSIIVMCRRAYKHNKR